MAFRYDGWGSIMDDVSPEEFSLLPDYTNVVPSEPDQLEPTTLLPHASTRGFQIESHSHAAAILKGDFPDALLEIDNILSDFEIPVESLVRGGGGEHELTQWLRHKFRGAGWPKHNFVIRKLIDEDERESISHEIDHVRNMQNGVIALEIEWNNKDPFFDRDLENFKRLHLERVISVGIVITRGARLQRELRNLIIRFGQEHNIREIADLSAFGLHPTERQKNSIATRVHAQGVTFSEAWAQVFCQDKYGEATTHWTKLDARVRRGVGTPCPLLLIGIPPEVVSF